MHKLLPHTPRHHVLLVQLLSHVQLFAIPWTAAHQASLSFTISESLLKLMSIESVMPSNHLILCHHLLLLPSIFPSTRVFPMTWLFMWGGQRIGDSASASVLLMSFQGWLPLGLTGLISLLSKGFSRVFSRITINSLALSLLYGPTLIWLLEKPYLWLYGPLSAKWSLCSLICCFVMAFFPPRSKHLSISWLQSLSTVILEPPK